MVSLDCQDSGDSVLGGLWRTMGYFGKGTCGFLETWGTWRGGLGRPWDILGKGTVPTFGEFSGNFKESPKKLKDLILIFI